jgi:uncharacterized membrane protein (DUF441 family)
LDKKENKSVYIALGIVLMTIGWFITLGTGKAVTENVESSTVVTAMFVGLVLLAAGAILVSQ